MGALKISRIDLIGQNGNNGEHYEESHVNTTLLLDSDIIAYKFAAASQESYDWEGDGQPAVVAGDLDNVMEEIDAYIQGLMAHLGGTDFLVCLSCRTDDNWRLKVLPSYKQNRAGIIKPLLLSPIKDEMRKRYKCYERPTLEADDIMGILSTHPSLICATRKIIVSEDKDMQTIPGWLYNPRKDTQARYITHEEADRFHLYQTLVGDPVDGYKGCPKVGPVNANKLLDEECSWDAVKWMYHCKGLTEEDALVQARVAHICRSGSYDFKNKEVKLWQPQ